MEGSCWIFSKYWLFLLAQNLLGLPNCTGDLKFTSNQWMNRYNTRHCGTVSLLNIDCDCPKWWIKTEDVQYSTITQKSNKLTKIIDILIIIDEANSPLWTLASSFIIFANPKVFHFQIPDLKKWFVSGSGFSVTFSVTLELKYNTYTFRMAHLPSCNNVKPRWYVKQISLLPSVFRVAITVYKSFY